MPNRIIREGINSSPRVNQLSQGAEILYRRLISVVDDYGRYYANLSTVRGGCWPTHPSPPCEQDVSRWIAECRQGDRPLLTIYIVEGCSYLQLTDFNQKIRSRSKFPDPVCTLSATCQQPADKVSALDVGVMRIAKTETDAEPPSVRAVLSVIKPDPPPSRSFAEWWGIWSSVKGTNHQRNAEQVYPRVVTEETEADCLACTKSYLASLDNPAKGYNPENFLMDQVGDKFKARWPPSKARDSPYNKPQFDGPEGTDGYQVLG